MPHSFNYELESKPFEEVAFLWSESSFASSMILLFAKQMRLVVVAPLWLFQANSSTSSRNAANANAGHWLVRSNINVAGNTPSLCGSLVKLIKKKMHNDMANSCHFIPLLFDDLRMVGSWTNEGEQLRHQQSNQVAARILSKEATAAT